MLTNTFQNLPLNIFNNTYKKEKKGLGFRVVGIVVTTDTILDDSQWILGMVGLPFCFLA